MTEELAVLTVTSDPYFQLLSSVDVQLQVLHGTGCKELAAQLQ